ncbi:unnamed protein product [Phytophthora fragariaefolia]|uniref:Unnamed protein product n=1 Tax=Phytophthora fragariaefolia TaxID=1490495 RepID=A0A9W7D2A9_9STRA|nr:unnamed protein product [Phytophthora fragariaefolia]
MKETKKKIAVVTDLPVTESTSVGDWKDEEFDVSDSLVANWIQDEETSPVPESDVIQVVKDSVNTWYHRLFTDEELDAMEQCELGQESTVIAGSEVAIECEEYGEEIEDRLYPLDEIEIRKRVKRNAEAQTDPSLEELAAYLGVPAEVLERRREASPPRLESAENWQEWYGEMLEKSEEAKRANRDFRSPSRCASSSVSCTQRGYYEQTKDDPGEFPLGNGGTVKVSPLRDKVREVRWDRLLWHAEEVIKLRGLDERYLDALWTWIESYCDENVGLIWGKLCERTRRSRTASARRRRRRRATRGGSLTFSSLYKPYAEALGDWEFYPKRGEEISHSVSVVRNECPSRTPLPRTGLVEVVTVNLPNGFGFRNEGENGCGVYRVVEDERRVVCAVGNFEALSSGYIDCLSSRMLADTGATLSLVDRRVLKRLGRMSEPLEAYEGLVKSSSGHKLRIRGWTSLSVRLGTVEVSMSVLVADQLYVDAIVGVDAL